MNEEQLKEWLRKNLEIDFIISKWSFEYHQVGLRFRGDERCFTTVSLPFEDNDD